ncbi:hypothetical protein [Gulosibacter bifidus]|uniref:DNA primase n=1 Tax=Gulosibacter bifidus TaxID=272239 RepID=A0ABW5RJD3_9MICO|nr:hypothetical protein [Gulosibacter bifidus]
MPKYAVLVRYEVISGLIIEADSEDDANAIARDFEATVHEETEGTDAVTITERIWGGGTISVEAAEDDDDAEDLIDEWIDQIETDEELGDYDEDDDYEFDADEDDDDLDEDEEDLEFDEDDEEDEEDDVQRTVR